MLRTKYFWFFVVFTGLIAAYFLFVRDTSEMAQVARSATDYRGQITEGARFGVSIGDSVDSVTAKLKEQRVRYDVNASKRHRENHPNDCHEYEYTDIDEIRIYSDSSWRRGTLCVVLKDDKMVAMSWFFQPGSP